MSLLWCYHSLKYVYRTFFGRLGAGFEKSNVFVLHQRYQMNIAYFFYVYHQKKSWKNEKSADDSDDDWQSSVYVTDHWRNIKTSVVFAYGSFVDGDEKTGNGSRNAMMRSERMNNMSDYVSNFVKNDVFSDYDGHFYCERSINWTNMMNCFGEVYEQTYYLLYDYSQKPLPGLIIWTVVTI